jgi:thioredoxin 1
MSQFNEMINGSEPLLVDFFAEWCGPCKTMTTVLKNVASQLDNKARIIKVDIDKNPAAALKYNVQAVPTFILFKKGEIKWRQSGALTETKILEEIRKFV